MKSFVIAALMAVNIIAAEVVSKQEVAPEPVAPVVVPEPVAPAEKAPADAMWTNEKIKNWVSVNNGGHEWDAFSENQLLTEGSRHAFVNAMVTNMVEEWKTS
jgi:hypothetical protein